MGLGVVSNNTGSKAGGVTKLNYIIQAPGSNIIIPANSFISWVELNSVVNNDVTIGTVAAGVDFFNDTVLANEPYEAAKGWKVNVATLLYVLCSQNLNLIFYKF